MTVNRSFVAAVCVAALSACSASTTPQSDLRFGQSLHAIQTGQTLCPQGSASKDRTPALSGEAAVLAQQHYHQSFQSRESAPAGTQLIREQLK
jgi:hypothetical protein